MGETYMEVLSRGECLRLLPMAPIGWISYCHASHPQLVPVNFLVHLDEVVARTTYGDELAAARESDRATDSGPSTPSPPSTA